MLDMRGLGDFSISMDRPGVLLTGCPSRSSGSQPSMFYHPAVLLVKKLEAWLKAFKGTLLGTPNWEPQEYSRYIIGIYLPGSLYSIIFLLYSWGSLFGVPSRVPLALDFG